MIKFELVTLNGTKFGDSVHEVLLPTPDGIIAVFQHHMPLVSLASTGVVSVRRKANEPDDMMERYAITGGVIEVLDNTVRVLVDEAEHSDEINEVEALKAHQAAKKLRSEARDRISFQHAQSLIDRTASQLKVTELKRHRKKRY